MAETVQKIQKWHADTAADKGTVCGPSELVHGMIGTLLAEIDRLEHVVQLTLEAHGTTLRRLRDAKAVCDALIAWRNEGRPLAHWESVAEAMDLYLAGEKGTDDGEKEDNEAKAT